MIFADYGFTFTMRKPIAFQPSAAAAPAASASGGGSAGGSASASIMPWRKPTPVFVPTYLPNASSVPAPVPPPAPVVSRFAPCPTGYIMSGTHGSGGSCVPAACPQGFHKDASGICVRNEATSQLMIYGPASCNRSQRWDGKACVLWNSPPTPNEKPPSTETMFKPWLTPAIPAPGTAAAAVSTPVPALVQRESTFGPASQQPMTTQVKAGTAAAAVVQEAGTKQAAAKQAGMGVVGIAAAGIGLALLGIMAVRKRK